MKKCRVCGYENDDDAKMCISCGTPLEQSSDEDLRGGHKGDKNRRPRPFYANWVFWLIVVVAGAGIAFYLATKKKEATYLNLSANQVLMPRTASQYDVEVDTDGDWDLTHQSDWIETSSNGNKIHIECTENETGQNRQGWITITSGQSHVTISVVQSGFASFLKVDHESLAVEKSGGTFTVHVSTDGKGFHVQYPDYCEVTTGSGTFTITFPANENYARTGAINVSSDSQMASISCSQQGKCVVCNGTGEMQCTTCGGTGKVMAGVNMWGGVMYQDCSVCGGSGRVKCTTCNGTGVQ